MLSVLITQVVVVCYLRCLGIFHSLFACITYCFLKTLCCNMATFALHPIWFEGWPNPVRSRHAGATCPALYYWVPQVVAGLVGDVRFHLESPLHPGNLPDWSRHRQQHSLCSQCVGTAHRDINANGACSANAIPNTESISESLYIQISVALSSW